LGFCFNSCRQIVYFYFNDDSYISPYFYVIGIVAAEVASFENEGPNPEE
jgi:hypothetical protein